VQAGLAVVGETGETRSRTSRRPARDGFGAARFGTALRWRGERLLEALGDALESELAERAGFQWLAVAFAVGCLVYFALPREPLLVPLLAAAASVAALAWLRYRRGETARLLILAAFCLAGAAGAKLRVERLEGPVIERAFSADLTGRVVDSDHRAERRPRIVLDELEIDRAASPDMPAKVRISLGPRAELPPLGARVGLKARLMPVAGPALPGGYDPHRAAFFERIGGSGFALGEWRLLDDAEEAGPALVVSRIRAAMVARILALEPGEAGAVAAALLVGERSALSAETNADLRASGLAHILSISGLHMMLIAGAAFFAVRALLALSPTLALTQPIRKWAAGAALVVVTAYFALSGGGAATERAYVMAVVMFTATLIDRPAISMRNLAIAAFLVLALEPEGIVEPGFQMSFAAVAALVAAWEAWRERDRLRLGDENVVPGAGVIRWAFAALFGVLLTSLVAGLATAPFAAYHFERIATFSLLGNLLAAPLVSLIIMPFGLLTLVLLPFGLEALALPLMARGIDGLLFIADRVAALPGAEATAPPIPPISLLAIAAGLLWLCLWRLRWRLFGVPMIATGLVLVPILADAPDILVSPDGKVVAVRDGGGRLRISGGRAGSYTVEQFLAEEGGAPEGGDISAGVRCDRTACLLSGGSGLRISHVRDAAAFPEDCRRADIVLTPLPAPADCAARLVIDGKRLDHFGAHAIKIGGEPAAPRFEVTAERSAFPRPWQASGRSE